MIGELAPMPIKGLVVERLVKGLAGDSVTNTKPFLGFVVFLPFCFCVCVFREEELPGLLFGPILADREEHLSCQYVHLVVMARNKMGKVSSFQE